MTASLLTAQQLYKYTYISQEEHREVWGNQIQDYVYYKGVHVGEPLRFYYETLEFSEYSKKFLVYYLQCKLPSDLHPDNKVVVPLNEKGTAELEFASTVDYIPIMLQYRKTRIQAGNSLLEYGMEKFKEVAGQSHLVDTIIRGKNSINSEIDKYMSFVLPPSQNPDDVISQELRQRSNEKMNKLNRLASINGVLLQECALHSLTTLQGRRIDMFYLGADKVRSVWLNNLYKGVLGLASGFAGNELGSSAITGPLMNMLTGGFGSSAATLGMGAAGAMSSQATMGRLMQTLLRRFVPAVMYLFSKQDIDLCKATQHPYMFATYGNTTATTSTAQYGVDMLTATMNAPTTIATKKAVPLETILQEQRVIHVFFDQFSHNWTPLESTTPCHFIYTKDLGSFNVRNESNNGGVALAYEMGASYRGETISDLLTKAFVTDTSNPSGAQAIPFKDQLRVMLFGRFQFASLEYDMKLSDELMRSWLDATNADNSADNSLITRAPSGIDFTTTKTTTGSSRTSSRSKSKSNGGGEGMKVARTRNTRRRHTVGGVNDTFDELDDDVVDSINPQATDKPSQPVPNGQPTTDEKLAEKLKAHGIHLLGMALLSKSRVPCRDKLKNISIPDFLKMKYADFAYHTHVVSVIPFAVDEKGNQCKVTYQSTRTEDVGPFIICSEQPFEEFIQNDFLSFMQQSFADIVAAVRDPKRNTGYDSDHNNLCAKSLTGIARVCVFSRYNQDPYKDAFGKAPKSVEEKLKHSIDAYSVIIKGKRDREQNEWKQLQKSLILKRKKVLREQQKYALNAYYKNAFDDTKDIRYNLVVPNYISPSDTSLRPRNHRLRYFERQRMKRATLRGEREQRPDDDDDRRVSRTTDRRYDDRGDDDDNNDDRESGASSDSESNQSSYSDGINSYSDDEVSDSRPSSSTSRRSSSRSRSSPTRRNTSTATTPGKKHKRRDAPKHRRVRRTSRNAPRHKQRNSHPRRQTKRNTRRYK